MSWGGGGSHCGFFVAVAGEWERSMEECVSEALEDLVKILVTIANDDILAPGAKSFAIVL